jgi:hypothetical protein
MKPPQQLSMQEAYDWLDMLRYELGALSDASECDPGSHVQFCLESVRQARFHAKAAVREISKAALVAAD